MATVTEGGLQGTRYAETKLSPPRERFYHQVDSRKEGFIKNLQRVASTLENASQDVQGLPQQMLQGTVGYLRRFSDRIQNGSTEELVQGARQLIRERPVPFIVGCIAVGFLAARILKD